MSDVRTEAIGISSTRYGAVNEYNTYLGETTQRALILCEYSAISTLVEIHFLHVCSLSVVHHQATHGADLDGRLHIESGSSCEKQGEGSKEHHLGNSLGYTMAEAVESHGNCRSLLFAVCKS